MARNKSFTGSRQSVGTPTLSKDNYFQLMRKIRKERERIAKVEANSSEVRPSAESASELRA
jgi:hypothetical protein